jgi:hypothetical protein
VVAVACLTAATALVKERAALKPSAPARPAGVAETERAETPAPLKGADVRKVTGRGKPVQIAQVVAGQAGSAPSAPEYSDNLEAQLGHIGSVVSEQLATRKGMTAERVEKAAAAFADSLRTLVRQPLTQQQFQDIMTSLRRRHFWVTGAYPEITDSEVEGSTSVWGQFIKSYLERRPMSRQEKLLLARQVVRLMATARAAMQESFDQSEAPGIPELLRLFGYFLYVEFNDPVVPAMKRPFSSEEMAQLEDYLGPQIVDLMQKWHANPRYEPGHAMHALSLTGHISWLSARIWQMQAPAPLISPDLKERMHAERNALPSEGKRFDSLPEAEKERESEMTRQRGIAGTREFQRICDEERQEFERTLQALEREGGGG